MKISTTRSTALKRPFKKLRNFLKDPWPRKKELVFEDYELRFPEIAFIYRTGASRYESTVRIDLPIELLSRLNREEHHSLFVNIGFSFASGHFLLSDFATLRCDCAMLDSNEIALLESQLLESLTEFRYVAGLDPSRKVKIISNGKPPLKKIAFSVREEKALMLNGGGKDSCVSAELLKGIDLQFAWLNAQPNQTRKRVVEQSGISENYTIGFNLSPQVYHDAVYSWGVESYLYPILSTSLVVAYLTGIRYLVTGNEHSADDPNLIFNGVKVNHQVGKTSTFENFFNAFTAHSILKGITLFSIARPFTDLRLGEMFSHFPAYYDAFFSCNVGMGTNQWCKNCHKCAFTYMAFFPFFDKETLISIFGTDLFEIPVIRQYMIELASAKIKPWECVGTMEECKLALHYCLKKMPDTEFTSWPKRRDLEEACGDIQENIAFKNVMSTFLTPHSIPASKEQPLRLLSWSLLNKSIARWPNIINPVDTSTSKVTIQQKEKSAKST